MTTGRFLISLVLMLLLSSLAQAQTMQPVALKPGLPAPELALKKILQAPSDAKADWLSLRGKVVLVLVREKRPVEVVVIETDKTEFLAKS